MGLIDAYAQDAITITPKGTADADGTYDFDGTAVVTTARVVNKTGLIRRENGREITYTKTAFLKPDDTVTVGDKITILTIAHEVLEVYPIEDISNDTQVKRVRLA